MAEETVIDWELLPVGTLTRFEKDQLEFEGRVTSLDKRVKL